MKNNLLKHFLYKIMHQVPTPKGAPNTWDVHIHEKIWQIWKDGMLKMYIQMS